MTNNIGSPSFKLLTYFMYNKKYNRSFFVLLYTCKKLYDDSTYDLIGQFSQREYV